MFISIIFNLLDKCLELSSCLQNLIPNIKKQRKWMYSIYAVSYTLNTKHYPSLHIYKSMPLTLTRALSPKIYIAELIVQFLHLFDVLQIPGIQFLLPLLKLLSTQETVYLQLLSHSL